MRVEWCSVHPVGGHQPDNLTRSDAAQIVIIPKLWSENKVVQDPLVHKISSPRCSICEGVSISIIVP